MVQMLTLLAQPFVWGSSRQSGIAKGGAGGQSHQAANFRGTAELDNNDKNCESLGKYE